MVERSLHRDYAPRMRWLPRPNSALFRATLAMALLAWTALAFGTPVMGPPGELARTSPPHAQVGNAPGDCHDSTLASAGSHRHPAPAAPMGHGDCCHAGCHCLFACNAVLVVPLAQPGLSPPRRLVPAPRPVRVRPAALAPPLRPPIA
ncbi:MAG TPA: hypothetical protein VFK29_02790, partial [Rhodanobacteraceae bacterium]|nr:hypothetical protein [Rhodanobacteraceae bacterium]